MKNSFSNAWKSSVKPGKQRKYRLNAPLHIKRGFISSHLSKELRAKYKKRSISVRKGDSVRIMRGEFKGKTGKIESVDTKRSSVYITGIESKRKDGTKVYYPINPAKLMIMELEVSDKRRFAK